MGRAEPQVLSALGPREPQILQDGLASCKGYERSGGLLLLFAEWGGRQRLVGRGALEQRAPTEQAAELGGGSGRLVEHELACLLILG